MTKWYEDQSNVISLAMWLDGECDYFASSQAAVRFFEKPWKWSSEWDLYQLWTDSEFWEGREDYRESVMEAVVEERSVESVKEHVIAETYDYIADDLNYDAAREDAAFGRTKGRD